MLSEGTDHKDEGRPWKGHKKLALAFVPMTFSPTIRAFRKVSCIVFGAALPHSNA